MRHDVPVKLEDNNGMWSRVYGGKNERREHIAFSGNEDTTMDNLRGKSRKKQVGNQVIQLHKWLPKYIQWQHYTHRTD